MYICKIYLFVCASRHVGTHVEVPRWVHKHDLESIMELWQGWLHRVQKGRRHNNDLSIRLMKLYNLNLQCPSTHSSRIRIFG